jgi:hypothetical protein
VTWKLISEGVAWRELDGGAQESRLVSDPEIVAWLASGNILEPAQTLEQAQRAQLDLITVSRNAAMAALVTSWDGDMWDANEETSNRIANIFSMIREAESQNIPTPGEIPWRTADNKSRVLTLPELTGMGQAVFLAQQAVWAKNAMLKDAIVAADTIAEVEAIVW